MVHTFLLAVYLLSTAIVAAPATAGSYEVDADKVYYGNAGSFKTPATIDRNRVFSQISAYKQIRKEGLDRSHTRYWVLLREANDVFSKALARVAGDGGYDLIAEKGAVRPKGKKGKTPPDVTREAIKAVKQVEEEG